MLLPVWAVVLGWLLTCIIVFGNGLVIFLIVTKPNLRTTTNSFVLSLALADFCVGVVYFPRRFVCSINDPSCADGVVKIGFSLAGLFIYASVTNLCVLTLDRYLAIVKPLRYATFMTKKRVALLIAVAWSVAMFIFVSFLTWLLATSGTTYDIMARCITIFLTVMCILACICLLFATVRILAVARKHSRRSDAMVKQLNFNHKIQRARVKNREAAATKMIGVVVAVFVLCYAFDIYVNFCGFGGFPCHDEDIVWALGVLTLLLNSAVNPIAYALFKKEMRKELHKLLFRNNKGPVS